jgi:dsDNA-specific endonuclease/ATPase MutS2
MGSFNEGDHVLVKALKKTGTVEAVLAQSRYKVRIGSLSLTCCGEELAPSSQPAPPRHSTAPRRMDHSPRPPESLDLHGLTVDDAVRTMDAWLDKVILSDLSRVKVLHGLGTGRVLAAVHARLRELKAVRNFKINERNPGETDVYL